MKSSINRPILISTLYKCILICHDLISHPALGFGLVLQLIRIKWDSFSSLIHGQGFLLMNFLPTILVRFSCYIIVSIETWPNVSNFSLMKLIDVKFRTEYYYLKSLQILMHIFKKMVNNKVFIKLMLFIIIEKNK